MNDQRQQLIERLKQAQNVLVTVSTNPSVDQLAAAIGLTLVMNHMDKHGTAVFSGAVPSTIEFLKPEETLERNTDSLRDFIIALDKSKADKLRYKVEDQVVRIFITPYHTAIGEKDLEFSQGDFNVDVVVALGVKDQDDLDRAITAHGRILHDATVAAVGTEPNGNLGTIHWSDPGASSLSEMITHLVGDLDKSALDNQVATALLTGIVASTQRFSNDKTTPDTMNASATLMSAGANQQLIVTQLEKPVEQSKQPAAEISSDGTNDQPEVSAPVPEKATDPGTLEIDHENEAPEAVPAAPEPKPEPPHPQIEVDEDGRLIQPGAQADLPQISNVHGVSNGGTPTIAKEASHIPMSEPPQFNPPLTANMSNDEDSDQPADALTQPDSDVPLLSHNEAVLPSVSPAAPDLSPVSATQPAPGPQQPAFQIPAEPPTPPVVAPTPVVTPQETLSEIEKDVNSPHLQTSVPRSDESADQQVDSARDAVQAALGDNVDGRIAALNALPLGEPLHEASVPDPVAVMPAPAAAPVNPVPNLGFSEPTPGNSPADAALDMPLPGSPLGPQPAAIQPGTPPPFPPQASGPYQPVPSTVPPQVISPQPAMPPAMPSQTPQYADPNAPPPVPPPMLPPLQ